MNRMMSKPKILAVAGVVVALGLGIGTSTAATTGSSINSTAADSAQFTLDSNGFMANGSGCPQGTVQAVFAPNGTDLTIAFSDYSAFVGPNASSRDNRKACTTTLPIRVPAGFTWGVANVNYRGYAELYDGMKAKQGAQYFFQGGSAGSVESDIAPDSSGNWEISDSVAAVTWAPCNVSTNLVITSSLKVDNPANVKPTQESYVSMDTQDISMHSKNMPAMTYGLRMQACK
jgi:hypothetical protein